MFYFDLLLLILPIISPAIKAPHFNSLGTILTVKIRITQGSGKESLLLTPKIRDS